MTWPILDSHRAATQSNFTYEQLIIDENLKSSALDEQQKRDQEMIENDIKEMDSLTLRTTGLREANADAMDQVLLDMSDIEEETGDEDVDGYLVPIEKEVK